MRHPTRSGVRLAGLGLVLVLGLVAPGPARGQGRGDRPEVWAIVVGAEEYKAPLPRRDGATSDSRILQSWLTENAGWGRDHVQALNQFGDANHGKTTDATKDLKPSAANLKWALEEWLPSRVKEWDVVILAFAGWGVSTDKGEVRLLPVDAKQADPGLGWMPDRGIEHLLRDLKCSTVLSWIDAPLLGPDGRRDDRPGAQDRMLDRLSRWPGSAVWQAATERPDPAKKGGAFARAIRDALGNAPRPVFESLSTLNHDPSLPGLRFRQKGGLPTELSLFRATIRRPEPPKPELLVQKGHADKVNAIQVGPNGQTMISASDDSTIRIWGIDGQARALLRVLPNSLNAVSCLALAPNGRFLVAGDGMGEVRLWDLHDHRSRPKVTPDTRVPSTRIESIAFLAAEAGQPTDRLVSIDQNGFVEVWQITVDKEDQIKLRNRTVTPDGRTLPVVPDGRCLAVAARPGGLASFAVVREGGAIQAFNRLARPVGKPIEPLRAGSPVLAIDFEGRRLAVGDELGRVRVIDVETGGPLFDQADLGGKVGSLAFGPDGRLAIGADRGMYLASVEDGKVARVDGIDAPVGKVAFSVDGRWMAGLTLPVGDVFVGELAPGRVPRASKLVRPAGDRPESPASCIAFGPQTTRPMLAIGENDGGVRRWDLDPLRVHAGLSPNAGQVKQIATDPEGRHLLQITVDGSAQLWNLQEGREVRTLEGRWGAGAFLADGQVVLAAHPNQDEGPGLVVVQPRTGRIDPTVFAEPFRRTYASVAVARGGRRVVAIPEQANETAVVWDLGAARPRVFEDNKDKPGRNRDDPAIVSVDFSGDGKTLLVAGKDGLIAFWNLDAPDDGRGPIARYRAPQIKVLTAAAFGPVGTMRIVAAGWVGDKGNTSRVVYWDGRLKDGMPIQPSELGDFSGQISAVTFLANGRYAAASGRTKEIRIWDLGNAADPESRPANVEPVATGVQHDEAINDLLAWPDPDGTILASGSSDTTVRFWKVMTGPGKPVFQLTGTLAAAPVGVPPVLGVPLAGFGSEPPWIAFTPDGHYDGSLEGDRLVSFVDGRSSSPVDQFATRLFFPLLTDKIRKGVQLIPERFDPPPPLLIEAPQDGAEAIVEIKVSICDPTMKTGENLRLYHNDAPVKDGERAGQFQPGAVEGEFIARVALLKGDNRFYAMATRRDQPDARSPDLVLYHTGADTPGRVHVIALGVGEYQGNALRFAAEDAKQLAEYLPNHAIGSGQRIGATVLLRNGEITRKSVEDAFVKIRREVKDHPEDTVVVFLAGHTDILSVSPKESRYSLLLPNFEFPKDAPAVVAVRGAGVAQLGKIARDDSYLPYATIYRNLIGLDALRRLVIVDACQADSILDDPGVRVVKQLEAMAREARQSRTDYFLASRRGEPAFEAPALEHGLLTYVLLKGMGASNLKPAPVEVQAFRDHPSADVDGDRKVTTGELRRYVAMTLPELSSQLASLPGLPRGEKNPPKPAPPRPPVEPNVQGAGVSFPLIQLPGKNP